MVELQALQYTRDHEGRGAPIVAADLVAPASVLVLPYLEQIDESLHGGEEAILGESVVISPHAGEGPADDTRRERPMALLERLGGNIACQLLLPCVRRGAAAVIGAHLGHLAGTRTAGEEVVVEQRAKPGMTRTRTHQLGLVSVAVVVVLRPFEIRATHPIRVLGGQMDGIHVHQVTDRCLALPEQALITGAQVLAQQGAGQFVGEILRRTRDGTAIGECLETDLVAVVDDAAAIRGTAETSQLQFQGPALVAEGGEGAKDSRISPARRRQLQQQRHFDGQGKSVDVLACVDRITEAQKDLVGSCHALGHTQRLVMRDASGVIDLRPATTGFDVGAPKA